MRALIANDYASVAPGAPIFSLTGASVLVGRSDVLRRAPDCAPLPTQP
jgi:hypothetical protein